MLLNRLAADRQPARFASDRVEILLSEGFIDEAVRYVGGGDGDGTSDAVLLRLEEGQQVSARTVGQSRKDGVRGVDRHQRSDPAPASISGIPGRGTPSSVARSRP